MALRNTSWRNVPNINPTRGAQYTPGGLGAWRSVVPAGSSTRRRSGSSRSGDGRGQPNDYERAVAKRALEKDEDEGFNPFNAGGKLLMGALEALDVPASYSRSALREGLDAVENYVSGTGSDSTWEDFISQAKDHDSFGELFGTDPVTGFVGDVLTDPLTYLTGGLAKAGTAAGKPAARKLLAPATRLKLGEDAVKAAERSGVKFADDAARTKAVIEQGDVIAAQEAQKALQFRSNQALSPSAREAIGNTPGTYIRLPGQKRLKIDALVEKIAPRRLVEGRGGRKVIKLTKRELGAGRVASKARAKVTQNAFSNKLARGFTKYPDLREKVLFGTPEESAHAFLALGKRTAGDLQRRLKDVEWGGPLEDLLKRSKKAHIDGVDLRYAVAEHMGGEVMGPSLSRVAARAAAAGDETLVQEWRDFFPKLAESANDIDPELPWLRVREDYTVSRPSDEMLALRGQWSAGEGALKRDVFDFRQQYGADEGQINELFGEKLHHPTAEDPRSVRQQIDDALEKKGVPKWFEQDAYKAFPEHVTHMARRYGDEYMAKQLRDLGIAEPSILAAVGAQGLSIGKRKSTLQKQMIRAQIRAERREAAAAVSRSKSDALEQQAANAGRLSAASRKSKALAEAEAEGIKGRMAVLKPERITEYEAGLREQAQVLATRRQALLDQIDIADDQAFVLDHAQVELSHKIKLETYAATQQVTRLEKALGKGYEELGELYDRVLKLEKGEGEGAIAREALKEMQQNEARIVELTGQIEAGERTLHQFEDLAEMPTDQLDQQLTRVDQKLQEVLSEYDEVADQSLVNKIEALGNAKASILHEKGVIERARNRVAELDRSNPQQILAEMDDLRKAEDMGDKLIHSLFPDLPDEINGMRIRDYYATRLGDVYEQVENTRGQVLSAYNNRTTMQAELAQIRAQHREAQRNLRKVTKDVNAKDRALWEEQDSLLVRADEAASKALELDKTREQLAQQLGQAEDTIKNAEWADSIAEGYLASMQAKRLRYEAEALTKETTAKGAREVADLWQKVGQGNFSEAQKNATRTALKDQFREIGAVSVTQDKWLVDGLRAATVMMGPDFLRPVLRGYDRVLNQWKAYALATPGTVLRNLFGGVFNNGLAGHSILTEDYTKTMSYLWGRGKGVKDADKAILDEIRSSGMFVGSGTSLEIERTLGPGKLNPLSQDFKLLRFARGKQNDVENLVRGTLAFRVLKNGGSMDDAIGEVMKFHFDYDDLAAFERSVLRRVVPFYTWTRKNFPLMLEQIVQNPSYFSRFYQAKQEIEHYSPEEKMIPSYFTENMATRLPFSLGGSQAYMLPDLPFTSLNDVTDPSVAFSQLSPFVKTPLEYAMGKQVFKGIPLRDEYEPVPRWLEGVPGIFQGLDAMGLAEIGEDGHYYMKHKDMYVAEQLLPTYGKARRLFPSDDRYSERVLSNWLSFGFGAGLRTNTPTDQRNEAGSRVSAELEDVATLKELGYLTEDDKLPRPGQTFRAAYDQLGV